MHVLLELLLLRGYLLLGTTVPVLVPVQPWQLRTAESIYDRSSYGCRQI
jgi:hypothetical protein